MSGTPGSSSRNAPAVRPCSQRRSGAHTTPHSTPCLRVAPARRPRGSPSAPTQCHRPSRPSTAVASPPEVVGPGDATTEVVMLAAHHALPTTRHVEQGVPAPRRATSWRTSRAPQCATAQPPASLSAARGLIRCSRSSTRHRTHITRATFGHPPAATTDWPPAVILRAHPPVHRNRGGPLGDLRARRARAMRTPRGPLMPGAPRGQHRTTSGLEHTPGKITSQHQQMHPTIHRGQRPPHHAPHRISPSSWRAARSAHPTRAARLCSSLNPDTSPAKASAISPLG